MQPIPLRPVTYESVVPNPKLKLLDQVREVMRLKHYSIRTERSYCDWVRRYVRFHEMRSREELLPAEPKMEAFLSNLAVMAAAFVCWKHCVCGCRMWTLG